MSDKNLKNQNTTAGESDTSAELGLLPCPFCGGKPVFHQDHFDGTDSIYCKDCSACVSDSDFETRDATKNWNKRHGVIDAEALKWAIQQINLYKGEKEVKP